ncbi:MAG: Asp-tRNA(Asn)/Glu-tRNA(Gln) amidotransferase subunit GatB, partial [Candidatus Falkowbacteria bacterium]|nr:Asp-tRNA(Asn)/Glu-tRNA(Gln) amidotransferase subunit GatB [Candidatus Falkowbacteria bacterium]
MYDVIIGLEIHAELKTKSKMFCACNNNSTDKAPNSLVCPICLGHPGTLPVPNKQAIEWTLLTGLALNCEVNRLTKFDRKHYFYPDLPKGYQISQYDLPLVYNGFIEVSGQKIAITRIHLEEDTGKLTHPANRDFSLVDYNRAGTPLMEMVTEPVIKDGETAKKFCQLYQQILRYLDISNADMEKGEMRCEANISLQKKGTWKYTDGQIKPNKGCRLNPKIEVKNINSFKAVEKAINYEIKRQTEALNGDEKLVQETRGWNEDKGKTISQRIKENASDYRYFFEPDIPPLSIDKNWLEQIKVKLIELPPAKIKRFREQYDLNEDIASIIASDRWLANYTEEVISELQAWIIATGDNWERSNKVLVKITTNWLISELFRHLNIDGKTVKDTKITPENFAELITLIHQDKINSSAGQTILTVMYKKGGSPIAIMKELSLEQMHDEKELEIVIKKIIQLNPEQVKGYNAGKEALLQF